MRSPRPIRQPIATTIDEHQRAILENQISEFLPNGFFGVGIGADGELYQIHIYQNGMQYRALKDGVIETVQDTYGPQPDISFTPDSNWLDDETDED